MTPASHPVRRGRTRRWLALLLSPVLALALAVAVNPSPAQAFGSTPVAMGERAFRTWAVGKTFGPNRYTHGGVATITGWHWATGGAAGKGAWRPNIHYGVDPRWLMRPVGPMSARTAGAVAPTAVTLLADCSWCPWDWDWSGFFYHWEQGHFLNFFHDLGQCSRGATIDMGQVYAGQALILLIFGWASKLNPYALAALAAGNCLAAIFK